MTLPFDRIGRYEVIRELGRGAMGAVYEVRDPSLDRAVALKVILESVQTDETLRRFEREARAAARLEHPGIVTIYELGVDGGRPFIAMELLRGRSLHELMKEGWPPLVAHKVELVRQICLALGHAHDLGVVHRDVKPSNIQVLPDGRTKLLDFGIARANDEALQTKAGALLGSPAYMSPEQIQGQGADRRSDIWAVGVVLYQMLAGRLPFEGATFHTLMYRIVQEPPYAFDADSLAVPPHLAAVVRKALQKDPAQRFGHMRELIAALDGNPIADAAVSTLLETSDSAVVAGRPGLRATPVGGLGLAPAAAGPVASPTVIEPEREESWSFPKPLEDAFDGFPAPLEESQDVAAALAATASIAGTAVAADPAADSSPTVADLRAALSRGRAAKPEVGGPDGFERTADRYVAAVDRLLTEVGGLAEQLGELAVGRTTVSRLYRTTAFLGREKPIDVGQLRLVWCNESLAFEPVTEGLAGALGRLDLRASKTVPFLLENSLHLIGRFEGDRWEVRVRANLGREPVEFTTELLLQLLQAVFVA